MGLSVSKFSCLPCCAQPIADRDIPHCEKVTPEKGVFAVQAFVAGPKGQDVGRVRFICVSDTHGFHRKLQLPNDPDIIFLHCGDFSGGRSKGGDQAPPGLKGLQDFNDWLGTLPYKHRIVIGGNHELALPDDPKAASKVLSNATDYLHASQATIPGPNGTFLSVWGAPHRPKRGCCYKKNKFEVSVEERVSVYGAMPEGVHVVMTHGPPFGVRDEERAGHIGDEHMLDADCRAQPLVHCFGHVHPQRGASRLRHQDTGKSTLFFNAASIQNHDARGEVAPPIVFDLELIGSGP